MRYLIIVSLLFLGQFNAGAFANESTANTIAADSTPQCMPIQVEGKTTTACFNLSEEQIQNLNVNGSEAALFPRCELRCDRYDAWGHCRHWHRVCW